MTSASLALGITGVVLALGSLFWQAVTFWFSGSRVRARLFVGVVNAGGFHGETWVSTFPVKRDWEQRLAQLSQHGGTAVLELRATNKGRAAVGMERCDALTETGRRVALHVWKEVNPAPGTTLDGLHSASWYVPLKLVQERIETDDRFRSKHFKTKVRMELTLGNGKTVRTRDTVTLVPYLPVSGTRVQTGE